MDIAAILSSHPVEWSHEPTIEVSDGAEFLAFVEASVSTPLENTSLEVVLEEPLVEGNEEEIADLPITSVAELTMTERFLDKKPALIVQEHDAPSMSLREALGSIVPEGAAVVDASKPQRQQDVLQILPDRPAGLVGESRKGAPVAVFELLAEPETVILPAKKVVSAKDVVLAVAQTSESTDLAPPQQVLETLPVLETPVEQAPIEFVNAVFEQVKVVSRGGEMLRSILSSPETAQNVAKQILIEIVQQEGGGTEIALSPPELGDVRIVLKLEEHRGSVQLVFERPETLELMRRHGEQLHKAMEELGYRGVELQFSTKGEGQGGGSQQRFAGAAQHFWLEAETAAETIEISHLDVRI